MPITTGNANIEDGNIISFVDEYVNKQKNIPDTNNTDCFVMDGNHEGSQS